MDSLFTTTTVLLSQEYTRLYSTTDLLSKLSKVSSTTGVRYTKANETFALSGSWNQVNEAFELLQHWTSHPNDDYRKDERPITCNINRQTKITVDGEARVDVDHPQEALHGRNTGLIHDETDAKEDTNRQCITEGCSKPFINKCETGDNSNVKQLENKYSDEYATLSSNKHKVTRKLKSTVKKAKKSLKSNCQKSESNSKISHYAFRYSKNHLVKQETSEKVSHKEKDEDSQIKKEISDKENIQNSRNIKDIDKNDKQTTHSSKQKSVRTPGEKGYWSRRKIPDYNEQHPCSKCGVVLKSRKRYMEHLRRIHIKEFQCDVCLRGFGYPTDLNRHKCPGIPDPENKCKAKGGRPSKEKSNVQVKLPCQECEYVGASQKRLNGHIKRNHRLTQACDICDKKFGFARDLERHKQSVHTQASFFCDQCSKFYKSKSMFEYHLKTHEKGYVQVKIACEVCGKLFTSKYGLNSHHKIEHLGMKKEYLCQVCGKKFSQRNSYKQHMNAHNGIKPYVCGICEKGFTYHKSLKEHKYLHDNIRRFPCKLCDKAFRQRTTLQIHMQVHKSVKDHNCSRCGKGFSQKQALDRHERIHTGIKPYTCVLCQRRFGDASTIRRHMKAIHQKTDYDWREDITCNLRSKTDYYVLGGSGQNRTYKSKLKDSSKVTTSKENGFKHITLSTYPPRDWSTQHSDMTHSAELNVLSLPQNTINQSEYKPEYTITDLNSLQCSNDPQANAETASVYDIQQVQLGEHSLNMNYGNGAIHDVDFNSLPQSISQLVQSSKVGIAPDNLDHLQHGHNGDLQTTNLIAASLLPASALDESQRLNTLIKSNTVQQNASDTTLSQTLASLWGIMGYPAYCSSNVSQYQASQNP